VDGEAANVAIVLASSGGQLSMALADLAEKGTGRERVATVDPTRKHARLTFDNVRAEPLGPAGQGWRQLNELYDAAAVYFAFEQIGGAESALWMARDYALERQAFGRQIGSYQGIKHKLADVFIKSELARSNAYYAAMMLAEKGADLPIAAAAARVAATDAYEFAAKENIQTHGGIGFTWEANPQFHYRRARVLALNIGGPMAWKNKLVSHLEKKNAA
jgi:acyl-CoA dehydrogenase